MSVKEEVLKELTEKSQKGESPDITDGVDLTLTKVEKILDEEIEIQREMLENDEQNKKSINWRILGFQLVKQRIGSG
ncbi:hypothetical protein LCGC14_2456280 [marine sediment metagenome]|uniref:Uncharacterized protein n=1 Tax=marine sediment metagenome TaxID=412755 RepID=A0A0F9BF48_9ZZZZ